ncbi:alpha/beta-Hydrolases superfamily protein [Abeliophyllum distichum]|uniref:Alpha/beta-Hydrolases superfamily protein n=1 Tax=Abeliophyllum distichum TaxID=126358 RepID=A0ABD1VAD1_9LAMI
MGILAQNFNIVLPLFPIKHNPRPSDFTLHQGRFISRRNHCFKFKRTLVMAQNPATVQQLTVLNKHGEKLVGILHETGSMEIVVLCHGFRSSKETSTISKLAVALENEGISAFRFDFAGNGESEGSFQYGNYYREVEDLRSVIEYFTGAKRTIVAILGHSKGVPTLAQN